MTDREHVHDLRWQGDGWGCTCGFWIEQVGSDVEDALNDWAWQKVRIRELEAQVAFLHCSLAYIVREIRQALDHHYNLPPYLKDQLPSFENQVENAPDTGREWLTDARAVVKALVSLRSARCMRGPSDDCAVCAIATKSGIAPCDQADAAIDGAKARGWLES